LIYRNRETIHAFAHRIEQEVRHLKQNEENLKLWEKYGDYLIPVMPFRDSVITRCEGCYLYDASGNKILDLAAGQFCSILGHNHPDFIETLSRELRMSLHTGAQFVTESVLKAAKAVSDILPGELNSTIFLSTGSEANEFAMRAAREATRRTGIIGFDRGYYGNTLATRSISSLSKGGHATLDPAVADTFRLLAPNCARCPLSLRSDSCQLRCLKLSRDLIDPYAENIAAIFVEPVISAGGMIFPSKDYMKALSHWSKEIGALLVLDEAQTGFGRLGKWFAFEHYGIVPDILVFSKTAGNGYPSSGVVISDRVKATLMKRRFVHLSSHQNDPLCATAVHSVITIIREGSLLDHSEKMGNYFMDQLRTLEKRYEILWGVRGVGLMIAFELVKSKTTREPNIKLILPFILMSYDLGVHLTYTYHEAVLRILPPIPITTEEIDFTIRVFDTVLKMLSENRFNLREVLPKNRIGLRMLHPNKTKDVINQVWENSPKHWISRLRKRWME
jgi:2,2-dialkylglycine decarboxylase (pyruvate)